jgi:hypothetical protein
MMTRFASANVKKTNPSFPSAGSLNLPCHHRAKIGRQPGFIAMQRTSFFLGGGAVQRPLDGKIDITTEAREVPFTSGWCPSGGGRQIRVCLGSLDRRGPMYSEAAGAGSVALPEC